MADEAKKRSVPWREVLLYLLTAVTAAVFPVFFLYGRNAAEVSPGAALRCLWPFVLEAVAVYLLMLLLTRSAPHSGMAACAVIWILNDYRPIEDVMRGWFPGLRYWHILFLCCLVAGHIVWGIVRCCKKDAAKTIASVLALVTGGLCVMNVGMAIPGIAAYLELADTKKESALSSDRADTDLPNFYYIIFDEYGGYDAVQKYYGYDGSGDAAFFRDLGFQVSMSSYAGTKGTVIETANLFNLDYVVTLEDPDFATIADQKRWNAPFFRLLQEKGYSINGVGQTAVAEYGLPAVYETEADEAATMEGESFWDLLLGNTVAYPWLDRQDAYSDYRAEVQKSLDHFKDELDHTARGRFYLLHVNCPHMPFVFDQDGGALDAGDSANWIDRGIYLGQYRYMTKEMKQIAQSIVRSEPDCIIVFQSDHGFRGGAQLYDIPDGYSCNILNNVYFGGEPLDIEGKTSINTLRTVLNELFGMDLDMITPPEGMFQK